MEAQVLRSIALKSAATVTPAKPKAVDEGDLRRIALAVQKGITSDMMVAEVGQNVDADLDTDPMDIDGDKATASSNAHVSNGFVGRTNDSSRLFVTNAYMKNAA